MTQTFPRPLLTLGLCLTLWGLPGLPGQAEALQPVSVTEWKAVYGQVEPRDRLPARARLGGTLVELGVVEGDLVTSGQVIGRIVDDKLAFQMTALDAQQGAIRAQLSNAKAELARGESLLKQGVATAQGLDALRTRVQVLEGQLAALTAQAEVVAQQIKDGTLLAPASGRVLDVPVSKGAVVMPGEAVAMIAGGGTFLRLQVPERHAGALHQGDPIEIETATGTQTGTLSRIYPLIQAGRVQADVELQGLSDAFVDARVLVRLPMGQRQALVVPAAAIQTRAGLDFVTVQGASGPLARAVVPGENLVIQGAPMVEILSGLEPGDVLVEASHD
ncbi:efflux RND transporter periplasmic adaptor subunit [Stagnihabitans tardus]|uniref:Efflux RND transporter periplasmic adaptor subunit n=1 Tax=Stagnihabitans tardus TaxID=2699202 RepID=A0AAE4YEK3_9RHOB|nr:efflux RND transporter periplasmic adaptor subunit [Stagnihabitans tardus]NBZ89936.1 efflux RND transporter periplasmic adaptor subunit [Stagnihabitans tardus]